MRILMFWRKKKATSMLCKVRPYLYEPLADDDEGDEEANLDGLLPAVLESRYERTVAVNSWFV